MRKDIHDIAVGDRLTHLRRADNLFVPFGKAKIRMVEDIETGEVRYIHTDGTKVIALDLAKSNTETSSRKAGKESNSDIEQLAL